MIVTALYLNDGFREQKPPCFPRSVSGPGVREQQASLSGRLLLEENFGAKTSVATEKVTALKYMEQNYIVRARRSQPTPWKRRGTGYARTVWCERSDKYLYNCRTKSHCVALCTDISAYLRAQVPCPARMRSLMTEEPGHHLGVSRSCTTTETAPCSTCFKIK